ncbi:proline iminopeptidase [Phellopilus nigrolimitatus]|nr:proline iminopeptidase [Phellopilus nigrolimitatus]
MYPPISPYKVDYLKVSPLHTLYYELSGNENGTPDAQLFSYMAGPGGGCDEKDRSFFNPEKYKIVLFDQRGSGKSTPPASLEDNTTWDLVKDVEKLREHLGIDKVARLWRLLGKLMLHGSTLALAYSESHPGKVKTLVLRGIFTLRRSELNFFYQEGASHLFPEAWEEFIAPIPEAERKDIVLAYHAQLNSVDNEVRLRAAKAWSTWEMWTSKLYVDPDYVARAAEDDWANAFAKIENHYFVNAGFMRDGQLLEKQEIDKMHVLFLLMTIVVQGRYDIVCPITTAHALKKVFPELELHIVPDAGHSAREPGIAKLLVEVRFLCLSYFLWLIPVFLQGGGQICRFMRSNLYISADHNDR